MSAADVIDEPRQLPIREQADVFRFLGEQLRAKLAVDSTTADAGDSEFEAAMRKVFEENAGLRRRLAH